MLLAQILDDIDTDEGLTADDLYEYEDSRIVVEMVYCLRCTDPIHWNDYAAYDRAGICESCEQRTQPGEYCIIQFHA